MRQRIRIDRGARTIVGQLVALLTALALLAAGLVTVVLALGAERADLDRLFGFESVLGWMDAAGPGGLQAPARIVVVAAGVVLAVTFVWLALAQIPHPHLTRHPLVLDGRGRPPVGFGDNPGSDADDNGDDEPSSDGDEEPSRPERSVVRRVPAGPGDELHVDASQVSGRIVIAPRAVERAVEAAVSRLPEIGAARARLDERTVHLSIRTLADALPAGLRAAEATARAALERHGVPIEDVRVMADRSDTRKP